MHAARLHRADPRRLLLRRLRDGRIRGTSCAATSFGTRAVGPAAPALARRCRPAASGRVTSATRHGAAGLAASDRQPAHAASRWAASRSTSLGARLVSRASRADHRPVGGPDGSGRRRRAQALLRPVPGGSRAARGDRPGRTKGFCPVPHAVRLRSAVAAGDAGRRPVRGRRLSCPRRHGLDLPRSRPQRERPLGRAQGPPQQR